MDCTGVGNIMDVCTYVVGCRFRWWLLRIQRNSSSWYLLNNETRGNTSLLSLAVSSSANLIGKIRTLHVNYANKEFQTCA